MELIKEIEKRRSRRALDTKDISQAVLDRLITAATMAPSCFNNQPWRFVVVRDPQVLAEVKEGLSRGNYWGKKSPLIILIVTKLDLDCMLSEERNYAYFGCGMAAMNLMLQATREGLYAHPVAGFKPLAIKEIVGIPDDFILLTPVIVGSPGDVSDLNEKHQQQESADRSRKAIEEVLCYDRWTFE